MENDEIDYENHKGEVLEHPLNNNLLPKINPIQSLRPDSHFKLENEEELKDLNLCNGCKNQEKELNQCSKCLKEHCFTCIKDDVNKICITCISGHSKMEVSKYKYKLKVVSIMNLKNAS